MPVIDPEIEAAVEATHVAAEADNQNITQQITNEHRRAVFKRGNIVKQIADTA